MRRCMVLAAHLFDPHRTPPRVTMYDQTEYEQVQSLTPGMLERTRRHYINHPVKQDDYLFRSWR